MPFVIPILLTFALVVFVGDSWPRNISPGSGLKMPGFVAAVLTSLIVWHLITRSIADRRIHEVAALICGVVGLMGWPVWSVGVLPSVNGLSLGPERALQMSLERTEVTTVSRSRDLNHWAWLRPEGANNSAHAGRYFIPEGIYQNWNSRQPSTVTVTIAEGLLGAQVVTSFE